MMTRKIPIMALIAGIVVGGAATEGFNVYRQSQDSYRRFQDSQRFQQRVHCKAVADAYVKENTDLRDNSETGTSVMLEKVDYSPARNSCVADFETNTYFKWGATERESVQDLLSGETLFSVSASQFGSGSTTKRTGLDLEIFRFRFLPRVWDYVMNNASEPVELEQEYAQMQSDLSPKASSPASTIAEPNGWQTVPAKEYDAQGKPITSPQSPGTGKQYLDPTTGAPIQIDPVTGERVRLSANRESAPGDKWDKYAVPSSKSPTPSFIPDAPASQQKPYLDPTTEPIQASKSPPNSAHPSLTERFIQSLATVIVVMPVLWLLGKLRKRDRDAATSDSREQKN